MQPLSAICEVLLLLYIPCCLCLPYLPPPVIHNNVPYQPPPPNEGEKLNTAASRSHQLLDNNGASKSVLNQLQTKYSPPSKPGQNPSGSVELPAVVNVPDSHLRYSSDELPISRPNTGRRGTDGKLYNYFKNVHKSKEREVVRQSTNIESQSSVTAVADNNGLESTAADDGIYAVSNSNLDLLAQRAVKFPDSGTNTQPTGKQQDRDSNRTAINVRLLDGTQLAMKEAGSGGKPAAVSEVLLSVGTSLAALFTLGLALGIFGCCCRRGKQGAGTGRGQEEKNKVMPDVDSTAIINQSELPNAEEDQDEFLSVKDKIRALDRQLILQPSPTPDPAAHRPSPDPRKKSCDSRPPQIVVSDKDDFAIQTSSNVGSHENVSRSDTQDDVSDITMDNESMHSSVISQPNNPDVVIAEEGEADEFAEIQRGTSILKSFQRVKPPRNRSPATRNSKARIRKSRPVLDQKADNQTELSKPPDTTKSPTPPNTPDNTRKPEPAVTPRRKPGETNDKLQIRPAEPSRRSRPLSASIPVIHGSLVDRVKTRSQENLCDTPNHTQSIFSDLKDLNAIKNKLASIQSQQDKQQELPSVHRKKHDAANNKPAIRASEVPSLYKSKQSPPSDVCVDNGGQLPSRSKKSSDSPKHKHSEHKTETDTKLVSPTRYKKHTGKSSPAVNKKRMKKHDGESSSLPRADTRGDDHDEGQHTSENRLSAIPAGAQNNIFYLIDPTVKNKCQSAGELVAKQNAQHRKKSEETTASKHRMLGNEDHTDSPVKRERTLSDPSRNSQILEQTNL